MTKTKQALLWLAQGKPRKDMQSDLGLTAEECRQLLNNLRKSGYIERAYQLTEKGQIRSKHVPKTSPEVLEFHRKLYRMDREESTQKSVAHAKRSQPNSVFQLGAMA